MREPATLRAVRRRSGDEARALELLIGLRREGKHVVGYGAPGKGNTLLNYCGIRTDLLEFTVDRNPYKQGKYTPGTHIPIHPPERIAETKPDVIVILPWNLARRDQRAAGPHRRVGRPARCPVPRATMFEPGVASREGRRRREGRPLLRRPGVRMGEETQRDP